MSYNFKAFDAQFPDDAACLHHIFRARFANHVCECGKRDCFHRVSKRRCYACAFCGAQLHPTAGTIFHKSETSLKSWFFAIFLFAKSKNGVAAPDLLAALEAALPLLPHASDGANDVLHPVLSQARAAIQKAKGWQ